MGEYLTETPSGLQRVRSTATGRKVGEEEEDGGKEREYELVTFVEGDRENPKNWSKAYVLSLPLPCLYFDCQRVGWTVRMSRRSSGW